ncbi:MAG: hypothetical protein KJ645_02775 [Planctomycetes bacterium]|nr:hypothetical protein [Planctomycetota bacterium]
MGLNLIGQTPEGVNLVDFLKQSPEPGLEGPIRAARQKLEALRFSPQGRNISAAFQRSILSILRHLGNGIERLDRQRRRRTRHAAQRGAERPAVGMALKDLAKVQADRILYDELHHTYIVAGPKWRIHVFGPDGRQVTSMQIKREGFQKRLDLKRWRYATPKEREELEKKIAESRK